MRPCAYLLQHHQLALVLLSTSCSSSAMQAVGTDDGCDAALTRDCGAARSASGRGACMMCAGPLQQTLRQAGCSAQDVAVWCARKGGPPRRRYEPRFRDFIGVNDFGGPTNLLDQLGVTTVRPTGPDWGPNARPFAWGGVQPEHGLWNWGASDEAVAQARAANWTVLPVLGYTAQWASASGDPYSVAANTSDWTRYCQAVAERYCSNEDATVQAIQIWNEPAFLPNHPPVGYFNGTMEEWVEKIHLPAAAVVRAAGCKVVFGGWPSCVGCGLDLLRQTLAYKDMYRTVDVVDVHYRDVDAWSTIAGWSEQLPTPLALWQTEVGFTDAPNALPWIYARSLAWALEHGQWVAPDQFRLMWYVLDSLEHCSALYWSSLLFWRRSMIPLSTDQR